MDWEKLEAALKEELNQRREEGCDITGFEELASKAKDDKERGKIYKKLMKLKPVKDFPYKEPSDLKKIQKKRPSKHTDTLVLNLSEEELYNKVYGAWLGRCAGCALGKPVEGWYKEKIETYLKNANAYPLSYYVPEKSKNEKGEEIRGICPKSSKENISFMEVDDDINYVVVGLLLMEEKGSDFTTLDVGNFWLSHLPINHVCTAERQAYLNLAKEVPIEEVPMYHNPYREWIGAQIRADFFGYVSPGKPKQAAGLAFKDANFSHVKNGIYGEMFVAAMIAAAFCEKDIEKVINIGLSQIPETSRLFEAITNTVKWCKESSSWEEVFDKIMKNYGKYHLVHTINNACLVVMALLMGKGDFEKMICIAVMGGLDTDCNGATVGSIMGVILGAKALPEKWTSPLHDTLQSSVVSVGESLMGVKISDLAKRTMGIIKKYS